MKYLIMLSLLFISCIVCKGQDKKLDSILSMMRDWGVATYGIGTVTTLHRDADSVWLSMDSTKYYYRYEKPNRDTILILMLISDINTYYSTREIRKPGFETQIDTLKQYKRNHVETMYGYLVIEWDFHRSNEYYLDADKNKLCKNIIVWKYIEIE